MARKPKTAPQPTQDADGQRAPDGVVTRQYKGDAWQNPFQGYGYVGRDKSMSTKFAERAPLSWQERTALYRQNWIAGRIVDDLAADCTRAGFQIGLAEDPELVDAIAAEWVRLGVHDALRMGLTWGLVYGGAVGLLLTDDTTIDLSAASAGIGMGAAGQINTSTIGVLATALDRNQLRSLRRILIVDARYAVPDISTYTADLDSPNFGKPNFYTVTPYGGSTNTTAYRVHWSRLLRFDGVPTDMLTRTANLSWGDSIYERAFDVISRYGIAYQGAALAAGEFTQGTLKMKGFNTLQVSKQANVLLQRLATFKAGLSAANLAVVDADSEEYSRIGQPVTGLPDLLDRLKEEVAAVYHGPQSKLWGNQSGKVAGAENDRKIWDVWVNGWQEYAALPPLRYLTDLILAAKDGPTGGKPVKYTLTPNPLDPPNLDQQIAQREKQAKIDQLYYGMNVLESSELRESRFGGTAYNHETTLDPAISASLKAVDDRNAKKAQEEPDETPPPAPETEQPAPSAAE